MSFKLGDFVEVVFSTKLDHIGLEGVISKLDGRLIHVRTKSGELKFSKPSSLKYSKLHNSPLVKALK